jgi:methylated-DNA-protein-cysteine methyltransferase-like protein
MSKITPRPQGERSFRDTALGVVALVPKGRLVSFGQVAMMAGYPRAARQVGWALHGLPMGTDIPWQRVVSASGRVPSKGRELGAMEQIARLREEGIEVADDGTLDLELYRWDGKSKEPLAKRQFCKLLVSSAVASDTQDIHDGLCGQSKSFHPLCCLVNGSIFIIAGGDRLRPTAWVQVALVFDAAIAASKPYATKPTGSGVNHC